MRFGNVRTGINHCLYHAMSFILCCNAGLGYSFLSQGVSWYGYLVFFGSLVIVVACYKAMQRGHNNKRLELYLSHGCDFANALLHCYSAFECV